ncbi:MAG: hypothetical protein ABI165_22125 [Bryobacteraceae bacterium]
MDQTTLLYVMTGFVIVAALALIVQAGLLFGIYRASRVAQEKIVALAPKVESMLDTSQRAVEQSKQQILEITAKANEILDSAKVQMARVEEVLIDASARAKVQLERAEMVLDDTMTRAQETVAMLHGGIMRPLREINGVAAGLRTAFQTLVRGGRPSVAQATQDDEMFI